jgi:hypothetical protein
MTRAIVLAIAVYIATDALFDRLLEPFGLGYLHAFAAMFAGMLAGGYLAGRGFLPVALVMNLAFSALTYGVVASMRNQPVLDLIAAQHPMVSIGSFTGAALGALAGMRWRRAWAGAAGPSMPA